MKKVLLSSAIAAALGVSGAAHAVVDFTESAGDRDVQTFATELDIDASSGLTLSNSTGGDELNVTTLLGFGVAANETRAIRIDISGGSAEFASAPEITLTESQVVAREEGSGNSFKPAFTDASLDTPATPADLNDAALTEQVETASTAQGGNGENFLIAEFEGPEEQNDTETDSAGSGTALYVDDGDGNGVQVNDGNDADVRMTGGFSQNQLVSIEDSEINVSETQSVDLEYRLYEGVTDAANENDDQELFSANGNVLAFADALTITAGPTGYLDSLTNAGATVAQIDVTKESLLFTDNGSVTNDSFSLFGKGAIIVNDTDGEPLATSGGDPVLDASSTGITVVDDIVDASEDNLALVSGSFSSATSVSNDDGNTDVDPQDEANLTDDGEVILDASNGTTGGLNNPIVEYDFLYETDGETTIPETQFAVSLDLTANSGFELPDVVGPVEMDQFEKNGSTTAETLALDPNGAFKNFIRISNTSDVEGRVFIRMINDDGESVNFALDDVTVGDTTQPTMLGEQASTRLIPMSALVDAAKSADPDFGIVDGQRNKFRIIIDGEFPSINSNNITLETDNTGFSTF